MTVAVTEPFDKLNHRKFELFGHPLIFCFQGLDFYDLKIMLKNQKERHFGAKSNIDDFLMTVKNFIIRKVIYND